MPPEQLIGQVLGGAYRIDKQLDEGGMGTVFRAEHVRLKRPVAVKVMAMHLTENPAALERFQREAEIISQLSHPHIVQVLDFDTTEQGQPYLVMELLEGRALDAVLARHDRLELPAALRIAVQAASALSAAHAAGVVHRDLKPANIFLVDTGDQLFVKLLDFGISKRSAAHEPGAHKLTGDFDILGTPDYMPPEQAIGKTAFVDHRGDQYALAVILYEMLTGFVPFVAGDVMELLQKVIRELPKPPSSSRAEVPPDVDMAVMRALSKYPEDRYDSILDFAAVLEGALAFERTSTIPNLGRTTDPARARVSSSPDGLAADDYRASLRYSSSHPPPSKDSGTPSGRYSLSPTPSGRYSLSPTPSGRYAPAPPPSGRVVSPTPSGRPRSPTPEGRPTPTPAEQKDVRRTSWHSKDPVKATEQLIERARQELGLDNLELAVSCAESVLEIASSTQNPDVKELVRKNALLLERVFMRRLGRGTTVIEVTDGAISGVKLSPEQAFLLSRLEGGLSIDEAVDLSPMSRETTLGHLVGLMRAGHIRLGA